MAKTAKESYPQVKALGITNEEIEKLAQNLSEHFSFAASSNIHSLIENLGGRYTKKNFYGLDLEGKEESGSICIDGLKNFEITIATHTGELHNRFTIAHEIGHYILHFLYPKQIHNEDITKVMAFRYGNSDSDPIAEKEANIFAASLLMPKREFISKFSEFNGHISLISNHFNVSTRAASIRADYLKLNNGTP